MHRPHKLKSRHSKRLFRSTAKRHHKKNRVYPRRGGTRL